MNKVYIPALLAVILLAVLHNIASTYHFYTRFRGFDIPMHILGGIGLTLSIYWILVTFLPNYAPSFWQLVGLTFLLAIVWEVIEVGNDIAGYPVGTLAYYVDTTKDLCDDLFGTLITAYFLKK